jgi:hypothetical protein
MSSPPPKPLAKSKGPKLSSTEAQARLADALRDNLRRRKAQVRAREEGRVPENDPAKSGGKSE